MTFKAIVEKIPSRATCEMCHAHPEVMVRIEHDRDGDGFPAVYMCPSCAIQLGKELRGAVDEDFIATESMKKQVTEAVRRELANAEWTVGFRNGETEVSVIVKAENGDQAICKARKETGLKEGWDLRSCEAKEVGDFIAASPYVAPMKSF